MITFIAEDDVVTRHPLQTLLQRWGHDVRAVEDGSRAVAMLKNIETPALVVLDWMMPGVAGPEVCRTLRQRHSSHDAYVIMLTALNQPEDIIEGLEAGVDDYLSKPVTPVELRARLQIGMRILSIEKDLIDARRSLAYEITHDEHTGLLNHNAILKVLSENLERSSKENLPIGVALVHFEAASARSLGFDIESVVIGEAAESLAAAAKGAIQSVRAYDAVGRFEDRTFLVIFPGVGRAGALNLAMRLLAGVGRKCGLLPVAINIGVASTEGVPEATLGNILQAADQALRRSRAAGPNLIEYGTVSGELIVPSHQPEGVLQN